MKAEKIVYYKVSIYADDGTNIGWSKPTELDEGDVFGTREEAEEWLESYGYNVDDANIEVCEGGFEVLPSLTFADVGGDKYNQVLFKLEFISAAMDNISKHVDDSKVTLFRNGIRVNTDFHAWRDVKKNVLYLGFLQKVLETFCYNDGEYIYKLTPLQEEVVNEVFKQLAEAERMGIGFVYGEESNQLFAFNSKKINYLVVTKRANKEDQLLGVGKLRKCGIPVFAEFEESKESLVIKEKK